MSSLRSCLLHPLNLKEPSSPALSGHSDGVICAVSLPSDTVSRLFLVGLSPLKSKLWKLRTSSSLRTVPEWMNAEWMKKSLFMKTVEIPSLWPGMCYSGKMVFLMGRHTYVHTGYLLDGLQSQLAHWIPSWRIMSERVSLEMHRSYTILDHVWDNVIDFMSWF